MTTRPLSLTQKLVLPLTALVVLVAVVSGLIRTRAVERGYHETMIVGADQLSRGLVSATWHAMLADDRQAAYDTMQAVARQQGISRIRIFNKEGRVMFSTGPDTGQLVDKKTEACSLCHASAEPLVRVETPSRARIFSDARGRHLAMITPIYNEPSCSTAACHAHPEKQSVLGVLDVAMDLAPVDRRVATARTRILETTALEVLLISGFLVVFIGLLVTRPIHRLIDANAALGRMDLEHPVEISRSSRELWELGRSFHAMRDRLGEAMAEINRASQELEAKVAERTEQLRHAHQHLVQADRLASLGQLAASVAHEINNPLSGVLNYSALMERILTQDGVPKERLPEFRGYLSRVSEQTARAGRIVSDLLAFSRRGRPQRAPADLNAIVSTTVSLVSHKLRLMNVTAELSLAPALPALPCDASQLQQVALNLVMNGAQATAGHGGGRVVVATRCDASAGVLELEVTDDGEGIAPDTIDRIFDPFFTTKEEGKSLGLGLAVVYGIVESHGGRIGVRSTLGQGTTMTVTLPLRAEGDTNGRGGADGTAAA